jgi:hypothetical protein
MKSLVILPGACFALPSLVRNLPSRVATVQLSFPAASPAFVFPRRPLQIGRFCINCRPSSSIQTILNMPFACCVQLSGSAEPAMAHSHDAQMEHFLRRSTGIVLWRHRSTTAELPFT